jgi:hypothetical protein
MPDAAIDACCVIDLCASGQVEAILAATGFRWFIPTTVTGEARYLHRPSPDDPSRLVQVPLDLSGLLAAGLLTACDVEGEEESQRFVQLATLFRSDGEAMALAIAWSRGWALGTDDRKARREAGRLGVPVVTTPELVKAWADATGADEAALAGLLRDIQAYARFTPHKTMPLHSWWVDAISKGGG